MEYKHIPVMLREVLSFLKPQPGQNYVDCTLGGCGYTVELAEKVKPGGIVLAIDLDELAIRNAKKIIQKLKIKNIILIHDNFKNLQDIIKCLWADKQVHLFSGIIFDLGLSSAQLEDQNRGLSFQLDAPLDMAFGQTAEEIRKIIPSTQTGVTTKYIVNRYKEEELVKILREYGEEKYARRIVRGIVNARRKKRIVKTGQLVEIIMKVVPKKYLHSKIHPATRTFQALRIATNNEFENLKLALPQAVNMLRKNGIIVVISYHSLEDRIVKQFFKRESRECICPSDAPICRCGHKAELKILTPKVVIPSEKEIKSNPRARSAKLRVSKKII